MNKNETILKINKNIFNYIINSNSLHKSIKIGAPQYIFHLKYVSADVTVMKRILAER